MEAGEVEEALRVLDSSISQIKWRLRPSARRRLHTDILALCTGLRPVVMVDYGGKMPELKEHLCRLMHHCHQESIILQHLGVMIIEDMIYLIHVDGLAEYASLIPTLQSQVFFVDLEQDPPKLLPFTEENKLMAGLLSIKKLFLSVLPLAEVNVLSSQRSCGETSTCTPSSTDEHLFLQSSKFIDLSSCMQGTNVTIPTLNGWLLSYPVVYLLSKEHIADAIYNLSTKPLHLYKIIASRKENSGKISHGELLSFSVPYDLSICGEREPWAEAFVARMKGKLESSNVWSDLQLEVTECYPQAIVL